MDRARIVAIAGLVLAAVGAQAQSGARTVEMRVDGLVCAFCAQGIRKNLGAQAPIEDVVVDLEHGMVAVALRDGQDIGDETLRRLLEESGFALRDVRRTSETLANLRTRFAGAPR